MQQDNSSFWTDIKNLEEKLAKSPDSFCFARLSEVYLKVGLIDDALHTARQGVAKHPVYLAGHRALAMACHAKGVKDDCIAALKLVTDAMPEDLESLKLLGRLSNEIGDPKSARQAFLTVLEFNPEDVESRLELGVIDHPEVAVTSDDLPDEFADEEIIEDLEILEELDVLDEDEDEQESDFIFQETTAAAVPPTTFAEPLNDPLSTGTLAELYVAQGFVSKALDIYRTILIDDPSNSAVRTRVAELESQSVATEPPSSSSDDYLEEESEGVPAVPTDFMTGALPSISADSGELKVRTAAEIPEQKVNALVSDGSDSTSGVSHYGTADNALGVLEGWLANIRRIKSCR